MKTMSEILFADDDAGMREMVAEILRTAGHTARLASSGQAALASVAEAPPDLVILDYRMGSPDGFHVCREIKQNPRLEHLPVLILTGEGATEDRLAGFDAGADDYLPKPFDSRELLARVQALLRLTRQGLDRNPTSTLPGGEAIEREYERRRSVGDRFALCYFDLDHFKPFGDRFGFSAGDRVIREVGHALLKAAAPEDFVGHIGGDDFLFMCGTRSVREKIDVARADFHERLSGHVPREVWESGGYRGVDRDGREREIPLTRLAVAILYVDPTRFGALSELGETIAELKRRAKADADGIAEADLSGDRGPEAQPAAPDEPPGGSSSRNS